MSNKLTPATSSKAIPYIWGGLALLLLIVGYLAFGTFLK